MLGLGNRLRVSCEKSPLDQLDTPRATGRLHLEGWASSLVCKSVVRDLNGFTPIKVMSQVEDVPLANLHLPYLHNCNEHLSEEQYRKVLLMTWAEECF